MLVALCTPTLDPSINLRLVPIGDAHLANSISDKALAEAQKVELDLLKPPHPLIAAGMHNKRLFYAFYKIVDNAFGPRPYVVQRIKKTVRNYSSANDSNPQETITYQVEVFKTNNGRPKGIDQHFGAFSRGEHYRREITKEYKIGFGQIPGRCEGTTWPFKDRKLFHMIQGYGPDRAVYDAVAFDDSRRWSLHVAVGPGRKYSVRSPELDFDMPSQTPPLSSIQVSPNDASQNLVLSAGQGLGKLQLGESTAKQISAQLGTPLEILKVSKAHSNHAYAQALTMNIRNDGALNTILTRPDFAGRTQRGIRLGDPIEAVVEAYGEASSYSNGRLHYNGISFVLDYRLRVAQIVIMKAQ